MSCFIYLDDTHFTVHTKELKCICCLYWGILGSRHRHLTLYIFSIFRNIYIIPNNTRVLLGTGYIYFNFKKKYITSGACGSTCWMSWFTYFRIDKLQALFLTCCMPYFSIWLLYSHVQAVLFSYKRNDILHIMFYTSLIDRLHAVISLSACRTFKILRELTCCMCIFTYIWINWYSACWIFVFCIDILKTMYLYSENWNIPHIIF